MRGVPRAENQGDVAVLGRAQKGFPGCGLFVQFSGVAALKLLPFRRVMAKPFAKLVARRNLPNPAFDLQGFLLDAARPEVVNQKAPAIALFNRVVSSLESNHFGTLLLRYR